MGKPTTITLVLNPSIEERPDRWAAIPKKMGIIAYAHSREEVKKSFEEAEAAIVHSFYEDHEQMKKYLERHQIIHKFDTPSASESKEGPADYTVFVRLNQVN